MRRRVELSRLRAATRRIFITIGVVGGVVRRRCLGLAGEAIEQPASIALVALVLLWPRDRRRTGGSDDSWRGVAVPSRVGREEGASTRVSAATERPDS